MANAPSRNDVLPADTGVIFLSWIFDVYGLSVRLPHTGEEIRVQSLLSPEAFDGCCVM